MTDFAKSIRQVDLTQIDEASFVKHYADCVVLTQDSRILLQQRPKDWCHFPGCLTTFGGHVEEGETVMQALVRELNEELGVEVIEEDVLSLGAVTEDFTEHLELVHIHFWHDKSGTITGCYEAEAKYYNNVEDALSHPEIMNYVEWSLRECQNQGLLK